MNSTKRIVAALALALALGTLAGGPAFADPQCAPGQHGNQHPGFKPGVCDNK